MQTQTQSLTKKPRVYAAYAREKKARKQYHCAYTDAIIEPGTQYVCVELDISHKFKTLHIDRDAFIMLCKKPAREYMEIMRELTGIDFELPTWNDERANSPMYIYS